MNHTRTIRLLGVTVWSECASTARERYYAKVQQPTTLPTVQFNPSDPKPKIGISAIAFSNPDGTLVATKNDNMPNTVWIWSIKLLRPFAVLVHLSPVKAINWHPTIPDLLMIQCVAESSDDSTASPEQGMVYLWSKTWGKPRTVHIPMQKVTGNIWAKWVSTPPPSRSNNSSVASTSPQPFAGRIRRSHSPTEEVDTRPMLLFGDREGFIVGYVEDEPVPDGDVEQDDGRAWSNVDWDYYSTPNDAPKRTLSNGSVHSTLSIPPVGVRFTDNNNREDMAAAVSTKKEVDDNFEYRVRKQSVSIRT